MKEQFEYFAQIKETYPKTMSKEQFRKVAHISKATALHLLEGGLVPCVNSGKKTRCYKIKTGDVITYLQDRIINPNKYTAPDGWYSTRSRSRSKQVQNRKHHLRLFLDETQRTLLMDYFSIEMAALDDLLTAEDIAEFLGYEKSTITKWCSKNKFTYYNISRQYLIPKISIIEYLASDTSIASVNKSFKHKLYLADFADTHGIRK